MDFRKGQYIRPLSWGIFVSLTLALSLFALQWFKEWRTEVNWDQEYFARLEKDQKVIQKEFSSLEEDLLEIAGLVNNDSLLKKITSHDRKQVVEGFFELNTLRPDSDVSIDIVDPRGNLIAWAGRGERITFKPDIQTDNNDTLTIITRQELQLYLSSGLRNRSYDLLILCTIPFELNYPISNRFVENISFSKRISDQIRRGVFLSVSSPSEYHQVKLNDRYGRQLIDFFVELPALDSMVRSHWSAVQPIVLASLGIGIVLGLLLIIVLLDRLSNPLHQILVYTASITIGRYLLLLADIPSGIIQFKVFDPTIYGTTFAGGLSRSPGDVFLSIVAFLSILLYAQKRTSSGIDKSALPLNRWNQLKNMILYGVLLPLILVLITRAYGAAIRSFVFDSSIWYHDPTQLLPSIEAVVMHLNAALLAISIIVLYQFFLSRYSTALQNTLRVKRRLYSWILGSAYFLIVTFVFVYYQKQMQFPIITPFVLFFCGIFLLESRRFVYSGWIRRVSFAMVFLYLVMALIVHSLTFDYHVHSKDRQELEGVAERLIRPTDSWLSFIVKDGLSAISLYVEDRLKVGKDLRVQDLNSFDLWARTILGREGYNSGVFLYDSSGTFRNKFTVGLSSYEQEEFLKRLYDLDEEDVQVIERKSPLGTLKYYGIWGTIRSNDSRIIGVVSLMISAGEQTLFTGELDQPLRPYGIARNLGKYRELVIREFLNDRFVSTSNEDYSAENNIESAFLRSISESNKTGEWIVEKFNNEKFTTFLRKDRLTPNRIMAVSLEELGWRWHIANIAKIVFIYLGIFFLTLIYLLIRHPNRKTVWSIGFRGKLIIALMLLSIVPIVFLGYYNIRFSRERTELNVNQELDGKMALINNRILPTLATEDDFREGINDDYCKILSDELDIDFSVFRRNELQASSRRELYDASILDTRMNGEAFATLYILGKNTYQSRELIGDSEYFVGYRAIEKEGKLLGVLVVPTLFRKSDSDVEIAERNVFLLSFYLILLGIIVLVVGAIAYTFSKPLRTLTHAAREIGKGNLDVSIKTSAKDEVGELIRAFNEMAGELKESRNELARVERESAWKEMAKQVAHEIRNPLTPMKLSIQHLNQAFRDKAQDLEEIFNEVTKTVTDQIDSLSRIAGEFANFARMPHRTYERITIAELLTDSIALFKEIKEIEFQSNFSDTDAQILADRDELRRVFINVIKNAIQAIEGSGRIEVGLIISGARCKISFKDTGPGIPDSIIERVFEPNFSTKTEGMGLGLAVSKRIIEEINGEMRISSSQGEGTTVEMVLPVLSISEKEHPTH